MALVAPSGAVSQQKLTASDGLTDDVFGWSTSVSGNVALIGAVEANGTVGAAYVFDRPSPGVSWSERQKLTPSDGAAADSFGDAVALDGELAVVGAQDVEAMIGDVVLFEAGAAYVYRAANGSWVEEEKLQASDPSADAAFGVGVATHDGRVLVGAPNVDAFTGTAYAYRRESETWLEEKKFVASDGVPGDVFGVSVALFGDVAVIGALGDDEGGESSGSAYVFRRSGFVWTEEQKLTASDAGAGDWFGWPVAISGDAIAVGARNAAGGGAVYVFRWNAIASSWLEEKKLTASDAVAGDEFGESVSISGDLVLVGATHADGAVMNCGAAYVFRREGGVWSELQKLIAPDGALDDAFGTAVSISGAAALVGASNADGSDVDSGAAYAFTVPEPGPALLGVGALASLALCRRRAR